MKVNFRNHHLLAAMVLTLLVLCAVGGCGTQVQVPKSPQDYVQTAKAQVGAAYKTIGDLKAQGAISQAQGLDYFGRTETLERRVVEAENLVSYGNPLNQQIGIAALQAILLDAGALILEIQTKGK